MPTKPFKVSKTYDVVTPESAEHGDVDDRGHDFEDEPMSLREALREIRNIGPECGSHVTPHGGRVSIYGTDSDTDYRTGAETTHAIHVRGKDRNLKRLINAACPRRKR